MDTFDPLDASEIYINYIIEALLLLMLLTDKKGGIIKEQMCVNGRKMVINQKRRFSINNCVYGIYNNHVIQKGTQMERKVHQRRTGGIPTYGVG